MSRLNHRPPIQYFCREHNVTDSGNGAVECRWR